MPRQIFQQPSIHNPPPQPYLTKKMTVLCTSSSACHPLLQANKMNEKSLQRRQKAWDGVATWTSILTNISSSSSRTCCPTTFHLQIVRWVVPCTQVLQLIAELHP